MYLYPLGSLMCDFVKQLFECDWVMTEVAGRRLVSGHLSPLLLNFFFFFLLLQVLSAYAA